MATILPSTEGDFIATGRSHIQWGYFGILNPRDVTYSKTIHAEHSKHTLHVPKPDRRKLSCHFLFFLSLSQLQKPTVDTKGIS